MIGPLVAHAFSHLLATLRSGAPERVSGARMIAIRSSFLVEVLAAAADNDGEFADLNQADSPR